MRYDIAIIGSGPAGLEAALTALNRNKKIIVFGSKNLSTKMYSIDHPITTYLGLNKVTGKEMFEAFNKQIEDAGISIDERRVTNVYSMGSYFALQMNDNTLEEASTVILATGVVSGKPYDGENEFLGRGVSYCATCDAPLYKDKNVIVISDNKNEEVEAKFLGEVCNHVTYIPLYRDDVTFDNDNIEVSRVRPQAIKGEMKANTLQTNEGDIETDGIFVLRSAQFPGQLVPGIEIENNVIVVNRKMETNIKGLYACGDITGAPYQFIKSAGEGNVAAISAATYLDSIK